MAPVHRQAARVLVIDERDRVLLLKGVDPRRPQFPFWHAPGGGIDAGEMAADAARREVAEEVGLICGELGDHVWTRRVVFRFDGVEYDQHEVYFAYRVPSHDVAIDGRSASEHRYLGEHRWFSVSELRATPELVAPPDLADRFHDLLTLGRPATPVEVMGAVLP